MMKDRLLNLIALFVVMSVSPFAAQEKKAFTLDDVIPGGSNYYALSPKGLPGLQWWGDVCVTADVEKVVARKAAAEETLFTLEAVNKALPEGCRPLHTLMDARFPWADRQVAVLPQGGQWIWFDFGQQQVVQSVRLDERAACLDFCPANGRMAYTIGSRLCITAEDGSEIAVSPAGKENEDTQDLVYGQAVHRNEFGIDKGTFWSPKGRCLAFYRMDQTEVTAYPQVNTSGRVAVPEPDKYPMAGMTSHRVSVGLYDLHTGQTVYLKTGDATDRYFTNISWSPDERSVYVIELNRDQNHARLVRYNAVSGEPEAVLYEEKHTSYAERLHLLQFMQWDETKFVYQSQRDGFNHLYLFDTKSAPVREGWQTLAGTGSSYCEHVGVRQLTAGDWLVQEVLGFRADKREMIIGTTEISPLQTNVFALDTRTLKRRLLGEKDGMHRARLSQSGKFLIDHFTSAAVPRVIRLLPTDGKQGTVLLEADDPLCEQYELPDITVGTLKAADGKTDLYYRLVKPVGFDPARKYPAIVYVYGGPHAQLITNTRFYGARGWDLYMAQKGYVMLTVDSRGSDNRGLCFENCTFRRLGTEEMKDQIKGVEWLQSLPYVDKDRIGVHGWSFGGFMTTNLMLTYNDVFKVGVAGGPVIDWQFYEVMYGERYMDTPQANPDGYREANLRLKAGRLKGRLEIIIGGEDPVCVPQHSYSFLRACIDAGTHPDFFVYPEAGHNMVGRDRVHLHEHITRYFEDHLK